jgi:hypothetical protein
VLPSAVSATTLGNVGCVGGTEVVSNLALCELLARRRFALPVKKCRGTDADDAKPGVWWYSGRSHFLLGGMFAVCLGFTLGNNIEYSRN